MDHLSVVNLREEARQGKAIYLAFLRLVGLVWQEVLSAASEKEG
jgi:hypothetical protein